MYILTQRILIRERPDDSCNGIAALLLTLNLCGKKMIVRGQSGAGKSTLVKAIKGEILGALDNIGAPENYRHAISDMSQDIGEKLPSSKVTIRQYFWNEPNDARITSYLTRVFDTGEYDQWMSTIGGLDNHLDGRISGGQKKRLILATRAYDIDLNGKDIIILDEPEQGSDPETAVRVLKWFFEQYSNKTIIMISHMCQCQLRQLGIEWDYKLNVQDGVVSAY